MRYGKSRHTHINNACQKNAGVRHYNVTSRVYGEGYRYKDETFDISGSGLLTSLHWERIRQNVGSTCSAQIRAVILFISDRA